MIIKKPYGFLIKHFKIIHFLMMIPMLYLFFVFGDIGRFFQDYVSNNYILVVATRSSDYITVLSFITIILLICINGIILLLMNNKKKTIIYYLSNILYYALLLILGLFFAYYIDNIRRLNIDQTIIRFLRDLYRTLPIPGAILMIIAFSKSIGFNIKTLRLDNNLDLHLTDDAESEINLSINSDGHELQRSSVHLIRELKYYIMENKLVFTCFAVVLTIVMIVALYRHNEVYNKRYRLYESFVLDNINMTLKDSYLTNVDMNGNIIDDDLYFLAIKIGISNQSGSDISIDSSNFRIYIDDKKIIYPKYDRSSRFIDIGKNYRGETIYGVSKTNENGSTDDYVLVYELDKKMLRSSYQMKILSSIEQQHLKLLPSYKIINVKPKNIIKTKVLGSAKIGDTLNFKDTTIGETEVAIKNVTFANTYTYQGQTCSGVNNCFGITSTVVAKTGKLLMIVNDKIKWDETSSYYKNSTRDFYTDFTRLKYNYTSALVTDKEMISLLTNVTPSDCKDVKIYEVSKSIEQATKIDLLITIRNSTSSVSIKS